LTEAVLDRGVIDTLRGLPSPDGRNMVVCVAELFARDSPSLLHQIIAAGEARDWTAVGAAAHALKSYAGNVGAFALMTQLRELELAAKAGNGDACLPLLAAIPAACAAVEAALGREAALP
jgi:HPt (histidine-containing phosphotransfer) domain-containing protein